ncbi:MAG TPA: TIGR03619 family F420-dependent LLM class oxidoreductase, partial [Ilumatobacteraceae bacterium]|nr:TIGR03619 family F420-dependent LLM class oxidoreductase [Ilumatobacteraceae bacterium]
ASATSTIRLATGVLIVPQRNPLILAKEVATLDVLSGGRVTLGVGVGWLEEEFNALGVPFADRGRRLDDYVEAMRTLWGGGKATLHNTYTSFDECISLPRPANGTVPIVVGGHSKAAAKRAARLGDGFFPGNSTPEELTDVYALLREECAALGRDPGTVELTAGTGARSFDDLAARVEQLAALGVSRAVLPPLPGEHLDALAESLRERFGMAVA